MIHLHSCKLHLQVGLVLTGILIRGGTGSSGKQPPGQALGYAALGASALGYSTLGEMLNETCLRGTLRSIHNGVCWSDIIRL